MKPFNLERAIAGDEIVTRDGREARFIGYAPELWHEIQVIYTVGDTLQMCATTGIFMSTNPPNKNDLFMAPKIRTIWVNIYTHGEWTEHGTQKEADDYDRRSGGVRLGNKVYKIEVEE